MPERPEDQPQAPLGKGAADWQSQALHKTDRHRKAKRRSDQTMYTLAQVGVLTWIFLTPVLLAGWLAHIALTPRSSWLALPLLSLGIFIGGALVSRKIKALISEGEEDHDT